MVAEVRPPSAGGGPIRALVTGGSGFAGRHLVRQLTDLGMDVSAPSSSELDLLDAAAVADALVDAQPERIFHLAARASVGRSWNDAGATLFDNLGMTRNLLEAARSAGSARVVIVSSGEVYGPPQHLPVDESAPLRPQNPYATSKAAGDLLAGQYADACGLHVLRLRPFNHAGPGQSDRYVIGTLTQQVADAEARGADEVVLRTGNPETRRDFTDVRDVVRAYSAAAELEPGIYNVASGRTASVRDIIALLEPAARVRIRHRVDPERVRAHDVPEVRGSAERLRAAAGWEPEIPLEQTVLDALEEWRVQLA